MNNLLICILLIVSIYLGHELRNPLHAIIAMVEIIRSDTITSQQYECLDIIQSSTGMMKNIVDDALGKDLVES